MRRILWDFESKFNLEVDDVDRFHGFEGYVEAWYSVCAVVSGEWGGQEKVLIHLSFFNICLLNIMGL